MEYWSNRGVLYWTDYWETQCATLERERLPLHLNMVLFGVGFA